MVADVVLVISLRFSFRHPNTRNHGLGDEHVKEKALFELGQLIEISSDLSMPSRLASIWSAAAIVLLWRAKPLLIFHRGGINRPVKTMEHLGLQILGDFGHGNDLEFPAIADGCAAGRGPLQQ